MEDLQKSLDERMEKIDSPYLANDEDADAILHKIQRLNRGIAYVNALAEDRKASIDQWKAEQIQKRQDVIDSLTNQLQVYAEDRLAKSKKKSVSLPSGKFGFRKQPAKIEHDDVTLLVYAKASNPEYVNVKESLDWAGLKKSCSVDGTRMVDTNGEILPGVTVTEQGPKFYVDAKGDEK